jgi:structural maintenance of chromosome 2
LITLDKERHEAATALEVCAGNRLYNIVVEDEKVGAQLLDKGRLKRRVTLIPLNKIQGKKVSDQASLFLSFTVISYSNLLNRK